MPRVYQSVARALRERQERGEERSDDVEVPPEVAGPIIRDMMTRHYTEWLDEPLPALDGRTPREAARLPALRPRVVDLVRSIENRCERDAREGRPTFDPSFLRNELDLRG